MARLPDRVATSRSPVTADEPFGVRRNAAADHEPFRGVFDVSNLDHLVLACDDLDQACAEFESHTGVTPIEGGRHVGVGTRNAIVGLGERSYIEIMSIDPDQRPPARVRPFRVGNRGALGLAGWVVAPDDIDGAVARLREQGHESRDPVTMQRAVSGGGSVSWRLAAPEEWSGGVLPLLIDWQGSSTPATDAPAGCDLVALSAHHPDPKRARALLAAIGIDISVDAGRERLTAVVSTPKGDVSFTDPLGL